MSTDTPEPTADALWMFDHHRIEGAVLTRGYRIMDVLNNRNLDTLSIFPPRGTEDGDDVCIVRKASLLLVARMEAEHEAPVEQGYRYVQKSPYAVDLLAGAYRVRGTVHLAERPDAQYLLVVDLEDFFAVTDAVIDCPDGERIEANVATVNRARVGMLRVGRLPAAGEHAA